jgi:hypothetical protein
MRKDTVWRRAVCGLASAVIIASVAWAAVAGTRPAADAAATQAIVEHVGDRRLVLLGETHGTREIPPLVEALVAQWSAERPVVLALEILRDEHGALAAYMDSDGGAQAHSALRARPWWNRHDDQNDGRRSEDMLDLIESMRRLRAQGRDVALLAYDVPYDPADHDARDRAMAQAVRRAHDALPQGRVVMLTGNVHAMLERPAWAPAMMAQPAGSGLRDLAPVSVRIDARSGAYWGCPAGAPRCGPQPAGHAPSASGPSRGAYTFHAVLPRFTPARLVAPGAALR